MGGYGAFKAAFFHPELFYAAASFSGVVSLDILRAIPNDPRQAEFTYLLGDLGKLAGSEHDPAVWLKKAAKNSSTLPRLFMACGRQDDLFPLNRMFHAACRDLRIEIDYHEEDGQHNWFFWDTQIRRFLALILDRPSSIQG
jgi:putative tributyrin esterase